MRGVVAAGNAHTAQAAAEILRAGGNAVDAAVAAAAMSWIAEPLLASPGGAGMMTVALSGRPPATVDFFSTVPGRGAAAPTSRDFAAVEVDFGAASQVFHVGRGSAAVPLALPGLVESARRFGTLPLSDVLRPAVTTARAGVPLSAGGAHVFGLLWPILVRDPDTVALFAPRGRPPAAGEPLRNEPLADLLEELGRTGVVPESLRAGILAGFGPERGGSITAADLDTAGVSVGEPRRIRLGDWEALTSPRVGGRLVALICEELAACARAPTDAAEVLRMARASATGHRHRGAAGNAVTPGSTTHISVVDSVGGAVAVTLTNGEGCGHLIPGTGAQMNNFLGEEDLSPGGFHAHTPGARLPTMIAPTVALHGGKPVLACGSGGSNRIRSSVAQVLYRVACLGQPLDEAVHAPRVHAEDDAVWLELEGLDDPDACLRALADEFSRVYPFNTVDFFFGGVHTVLRGDDGHLQGQGDRRRGGQAVEV